MNCPSTKNMMQVFLDFFFTELNFLILIRTMDEEPILKDEFSWGCRTVQLKLFTFRKL